MSVDSPGISVDGSDSVYFLASRENKAACLVIRTEGTHCEIQLDRAVVETLRDQLPATLAGLDRWAAETAACEKAGNAGQRAVDVAARALDLAAGAERAGNHQLAASLRQAAATASAQAKAVDDAVTAFEEATADADRATDRLIDRLGKAETAPRRPRDEDPAGRTGGEWCPVTRSQVGDHSEADAALRDHREAVTRRKAHADKRAAPELAGAAGAVVS